MVARTRVILGPKTLIMFPMIRVCAWNIRGLNNTLNQDQVIDLLHGGNFSICALLETKVKMHKLNSVCSRVFGNWQWVSNNAACAGGTGIIVGWDPNVIRVMVVNQSSQLMNLFVETINGNQGFFCSFVYAHNRPEGRRSLWKDLLLHSLVVKDCPWTLLGDFNTILDPCERSVGSSSITAGMDEFRECLSKIEVADVVMSGLKFTWNKSPGKVGGLLKKLDRVLSNIAFVDKFSNASAQFLPFVVSDHTPSVLNIPSGINNKPKPFKFPNFLARKPEFLPIVKKVWDCEIPGYAMYSVVSKLKLLKKPLRKFRNSQGKLSENVKVLKEELGRVQTAMVNDSHNAQFRHEEMVYLNAYTEAVKDEELMPKQRAKVTWLCEGDANTKFFHKSVK